VTALLWFALAVASLPTQAADGDRDVVAELASVEMPEPPLEDPPDEATATARTERLQTNLRCPVCQGLSVSDSPSDAARAMGDRIAELVREGYTEDQITDYFVDRYGAWVELEPPSEDHQALFWTPVVAVGLGAIGLFVFGRRRDPPDHASEDAHIPDPELEPWRGRILAELDGEL